MLCTLVKTSEGTLVECEVLGFSYQLLHIFPNIEVKALKGSPFWPLKIALVSMRREIYYRSELETA